MITARHPSHGVRDFATPLVIAALALVGGQTEAAAQKATGTVAGAVKLTEDGDARSSHANVVVYLEGVPGQQPQRGAEPEVRQRDLAFVPELTVVTKGTTVTFPNDDRVFHNVFSMSRGNRFDLGLYKAGSSKQVTFDRAGVVDVYCNIHPQMVAAIKVLDTTYYAVTKSDGSFRIPNVPTGTYTLVAWQRYGEEHRQKVTVRPGGKASVSLSLEHGSRPKRHLRKDGTPYGRYQ